MHLWPVSTVALVLPEVVALEEEEEALAPLESFADNDPFSAWDTTILLLPALADAAYSHARSALRPYGTYPAPLDVAANALAQARNWPLCREHTPSRGMYAAERCVFFFWPMVVPPLSSRGAHLPCAPRSTRGVHSLGAVVDALSLGTAGFGRR